MHCRAHQINAQRDERVEVVIERITEWRGEHDRSRGPGLMMVVNYPGKPFMIEDPVNRLAFRLGGKIEIAIVVMSDILLIEPGKTRSRSFGRVRIAHIPVGNQFHTVRIDKTSEHDDVI